MSSSGAPSRSAVGIADEDFENVRRDSDPQSIFYLNPVTASTATQQTCDASTQDIFVTIYSWATKIEDTVREKLGKGQATKHHAIQSCWDRAAFRAKLVDFLARQTPWFMELVDDSETPTRKELTGDYHGDKLLYERAVHDLLRDKLSQVPTEKLRPIERYIAETMVLSEGKLDGVQRFSVAFPTQVGEGAGSRSALRVATIAFTRKVGEDDAPTLEIVRTLYEAALNKKTFDEQKFDRKLLDVGKKLVLDATFDVVM